MYKNIHMMGIGGIGMSGIAQLLLQQGVNVSGCDTAPNSLTDKLILQGADITIGHGAGHITESVDLVVHSSAIKENHPELAQARSKGIPVWKRAQMLRELTNQKKTIAVTGTHGKTTVSFMITHILKEAGLDPSFVIGGEVDILGGNACWGKGDCFVLEADESDGSQIYIRPQMAVITNIDRDHLENYSSLNEISGIMEKFARNIKENGVLVGYGKDSAVKKILEILKNTNTEVISYGFGSNNDLYAVNICIGEWETKFDAVYKGNFLDTFVLNIPGKHSILNSLAAIAISLKLGISKEKLKKALSQYPGVKRRLEVVYKDSEVTIIDDYAHHPEEIRAVIDAVKSNSTGRLVGIFQPHRFTRTKFLGKEFAPSFHDLDLLILTDIYSAGEAPIPFMDEKIIYNEVIRQGKPEVIYMELEKIVDFVSRNIKLKDTILVMGAGDITNVAHELKSRIKDPVGV